MRERSPRTVRALLLLLPLSATPAPSSAQEPPVFTSGVDLVRIDVVVLDRAGRPVTGLAGADFTIEENGRAHRVTSFEPVVVRRGEPIGAALAAEPPRVSTNASRAAADGRCLVFFLDTTHLTPASAEYVRQALRGYLESEVREGDWVTVLAPEQELWWTARNAWEYRQLRRVIETVQGRHPGDPLRDRMTDWADVCRDEYGANSTACEIGAAGPTGPPVDVSPLPAEQRLATGRAVPSDRMGARFGASMDLETARRGVESTRRGLLQAIESMRALPGRKSLVLVADGFVLLPRMRGYAELIDAARRAHVAVDFLDPRRFSSGWTAEARDSPGTLFAPPRDTLARGSGDLVDVTGGRSFAGDPLEALRRVASEAGAYYLIGYVPDTDRAGERRIRVRVNRPGLEVRARSRYVATAHSAPPPPAVAAEAAATSDLSLRTATFFFDADARGELTTLLVTEVPDAAPAVARGTLRLTSEAHCADGGRVIRQSLSAPRETRPGEPTLLMQNWRLRAGVWQVRVAVEDAATGRSGSVVHTFAVPDPKTLRLSTPILTTALEEGDVQTPRLRLERAFVPSGRLFCQFTVQGATPGAEGLPTVYDSWELHRGDERVQGGDRRPILPGKDGHLVRTIGLELGELEPGDYELTLTVEDEQARASVRQSEPFRVIQPPHE